MPKPKVPQVPPTERIATSFKELKSISPELHSAAWELSKTINNLSETLEPLDLGVSAWATIASSEDDENGYCLEPVRGLHEVTLQVGHRPFRSPNGQDSSAIRKWPHSGIST